MVGATSSDSFLVFVAAVGRRDDAVKEVTRLKAYFLTLESEAVDTD